MSTTSTSALHVDSEVGHLAQVVVHRPGIELTRLTPTNVDELLFDDVMWAARAREEHDSFVGQLRDRGVVVHQFSALLADVLDTEDGREFVLSRTTNEHTVGPQLVEPLRELLEALDGSRAVGGAHRRRPQARPVAAGRVVPAVGLPRRRGLRPRAAAEHPLPARQHRVHLRRRLGAPDGQAGARARAHPLPRRPQLPPAVHERATSTASTATTTAGTTRPRARAATSSSPATAWCCSAWGRARRHRASGCS